MPNFKPADASKHDFPVRNKLFSDKDDATGMVASKYDVSEI